MSRGFTLIEMIVVLVILGLMAGLLALRGPGRSAAAEFQLATNIVAGSVRVARGTAIATARAVPMRVGADGATLQIADRPPRRLPDGIHALASAPILFRPDGSSSGGRVVLDGYGRHAAIDVSWLDGRLSFPGAP